MPERAEPRGDPTEGVYSNMINSIVFHYSPIANDQNILLDTFTSNKQLISNY